MQIVIDIPQGLKIDFENENWTALTCAEMKNALMCGIPLPENATNGDVIKTLFPKCTWNATEEDKEWWNAPYEGSDTE